MPDQDQEIEVKYTIADLPALERRLQSLGATLAQPRVHEVNLRFDRPDGELTRNAQVLRLRQDTEARLTYKGPSRFEGGAKQRQEIEFTVSDFAKAQRFLLALGYLVSMRYEKYRTTYDLDEVHVTLDEMPYGNFAELEGPDSNTIQAVNQKLGLDWSAAAVESYTVLFDRLREKMHLPFRDLTFENFKDMHVTPKELDLRFADRQG